MATPRLMAGDTPQTGATTTDSYAGIMDTARAERHRSSRVGRRAETRPNPRGGSRKRRQKGEAARSARLSLRSSTSRKRPRSRRRSRVRRFRLILGRHDNHAWCRKFESALHHRTEIPHPCGFGPRWRDPDSNRGHRDFQSCGRDARKTSKFLEPIGFTGLVHRTRNAAVCGLSPAVQEMRGASSPNRRASAPLAAPRRAVALSGDSLELVMSTLRACSPHTSAARTLAGRRRRAAPEPSVAIALEHRASVTTVDV